MKILAVIGSASQDSSNLKLVEFVKKLMPDSEVEIINNLSDLPHFDTELTNENTPELVEIFREKIKTADGIIFSTPEYIFSVPSRLKNLLEWCVSTTVFNEKPVSIITASASGEKAHEELNLILTTLGANIDQRNCILIKGIKGRFDENGLMNLDLEKQIKQMMINFKYSLK